ncbi:MAG: 1-(5-phosphoribosyl)-5-[(5-phosphoribosylamino)methylideneamino]imidazole-4-carboxamide isomerase [Nitrospirales bacterium]|nr:1-(5-phosphoribosyl)-5-[(5-phosphoribosylamino)methylideneamino]imidazole-4-carboxamide isomerase [Nitrospirales bacterium]
MIIIPAVDIKDGRCVRLRQGDMNQETLYANNPVAMAIAWEQQGAECLHIVDLNGAVEGIPKNLDQLTAIAKMLSIPVQVGGGIRSLDTIRLYLSHGIKRVVLGTVALTNTELIKQACKEFPGQILVGVDVKQGKVAVQGWTDVSETSPETVFNSLATLGVAGVIYTDISRDGMLSGPNLEALALAIQQSPCPVIASGGITKLDDIMQVKRLGSNISGIIIGKALYEGTIDLPSAIQAASSALKEDSAC